MKDGGLKGREQNCLSQYSQKMSRKTGTWVRDVLLILDVVGSLGARQFGRARGREVAQPRCLLFLRKPVEELLGSSLYTPQMIPTVI